MGHKNVNSEVAFISTPATSDFPFDPSDPPYLPHDQVLRYYRRFADHHRLRNFIQFHTRVVKVDQLLEDADAKESTKAWRVVTRRKKEGAEEEEEEVEEEHFFDFVMLCSGVYSKPFMPGMERIKRRIRLTLTAFNCCCCCCCCCCWIILILFIINIVIVIIIFIMIDPYELRRFAPFKFLPVVSLELSLTIAFMP